MVFLQHSCASTMYMNISYHKYKLSWLLFASYFISVQEANLVEVLLKITHNILFVLSGILRTKVFYFNILSYMLNLLCSTVVMKNS